MKIKKKHNDDELNMHRNIIEENLDLEDIK